MLALLAPLPARAAVSFVRDVAPILVEQCLECHRADKSKGAYRVDHFEVLLKAGDSEAAPIVPGKPEASELFRLIALHDEDDRMPKKGDPLPDKQQALVRQWIAEGAKYDAKDRRAALSTLIPEKPRPKAPEIYPRPLPVTALAVRPDGEQIAVSGYYEVTLWNARTGKLTGRIGNMPEKINSLAWIGTSGVLAVGGGSPMRSGELWLVDTKKANAPRRLFVTKDTLLALASSSDGSLLAAGGADNHVRLFAMPGGRQLWDVEPHADWVMALAISPDKKHIASASRDRTARLLDADKGSVDATHTGHAVTVSSIAFKLDGKEIFSGDAEGQVRRWNLGGDGIKDTTLRPARVDVLQIGFLGADVAVALANGQVSSFDLKSRKLKGKLVRHDDRVNELVVTGFPENLRIVTGSHDGEVRVFDLKEKKELLKFIASPGIATPP